MFKNLTNSKCVAGFDPKPAEVHGGECFLKHNVNEGKAEGEKKQNKTGDNFRKRAKEKPE